jgi:hypothetical protein
MVRSCEKNPDLTGKKFGRLLVLKRAQSRHNRATWLCICDCGKTKIVLGRHLRIGKTKSCGCIRRELALKSIAHARESNFLPYGEASFNVMFYTYQIHAQERGLVFEINKDRFRELTKSKCFYCGDEPNTLFKPNSSNGSYLSNGVDRIDNSIGYTAENCVSCCRVCNQMKSNRSYDDFISRCWRITRGHKPSVQIDGVT